MSTPAPEDIPRPTFVEIGWEEAREVNRANWDDRARLHAEAYWLEPFRTDPAHLSTVIEDDLPVLLEHLGRDRLDGVDLIHLQCHIGTDTVSLARAGARVTGLDFSPKALGEASALAAELGLEIRWVEGDVLEAARLIGEPADVVYTSIGALCWLNDLETWARQVASLLRPGGVFMVRDGHPMLYAIDEFADQLVVRHPYFGSGRATQWDDPGTYLGDGTVDHPRTFEWPHPVSEVVGALLRGGLVLERLDEGRTLPWRFCSRMVESTPERWT